VRFLRYLLIPVAAVAIFFAFQYFEGSSEPAAIANSVRSGDQVEVIFGRISKVLDANKTHFQALSPDIKSLQAANNKLAKTEDGPNKQFNKLTTQLVNDNQELIRELKTFVVNPTQKGANKIEGDAKTINSVTAASNALIHRLFR
jgi:glycerate-2-kinase